MARFASSRLSVLRCLALAGLVIAIAGVAASTAARCEALLLVEADTGKVLQAENATYPWYPASLSKLMTAYVTLRAVKSGRITLDTLFTVSPYAASQQPAKMGFKAGTQLTVDNALKMMMVKSANDMAVVLAEGLDGSIDNFAAEMNKTALGLGMTQTSYVNPNGLPADGQITSARDLAILARAIIRDLPEYEYFVHIPAIKFGRRVTANYNKLIGRYPGADGMKTGFICASGFNLVATATRNNKRLIAVVLGASSSSQRAVKAAQMLERGFHGSKLAWLKPSLGNVNMLQPIDATPPNLRDDMCGPKRKRPAAEDEDDEDVEVNADSSEGGVTAFAAGLQTPTMKASELMATPAAPATPVIVYTGPTRTGDGILAADAAESARQDAARPVKKRKGAARSKLAAAKPNAAADKPDSKPAAKPVAGAAKPVAAAAKPAAVKPATPASAKPKPAAKDSAKSAAKPAPGQKADAAARL